MQNRLALDQAARGRALEWDDMRFFLAVAEFGSFTTAATALKADQTTVGRRIRDLEKSLGTQLFDRHSKGMRLTPSARAILGDVTRMDQAAASIARRLTGLDKEMEGVVRISATEGLGTYWLTPRLVAFQQAFPGLMIEIVSENEQADLLNREADIAIRLVRPQDPRLVCKKVGTLRFSLFAAEPYIRLFGMPESVEDLAKHRLVDLTVYQDSRSLGTWNKITADRSHVVFCSNTSSAFFQAVKCGYGIGLFPTYNRIITPELIQLPIDIDCFMEIWLVSHEETNRSARTQELLKEISVLFKRDRAEWFS